METKRISLPSFSLIGIGETTTNEKEMTGTGIISRLNREFYQNQLGNEIPNKLDSTILALYTGYESDETGAYLYSLGAKVSEIENVPNGMQGYCIPETSYVVFTSRRGNLKDVVIETWQYIWEWSKTNKRAFLCDFEVYDERARNTEDSQVDIYISVK